MSNSFFYKARFGELTTAPIPVLDLRQRGLRDPNCGRRKWSARWVRPACAEQFCAILAAHAVGGFAMGRAEELHRTSLREWCCADCARSARDLQYFTGSIDKTLPPVLCCTVLYSTLLHCTVLYCSVFKCTILYWKHPRWTHMTFSEPQTEPSWRISTTPNKMNRSQHTATTHLRNTQPSWKH